MGSPSHPPSYYCYYCRRYCGTSLYPLLCFGAPNPSPRFGVFLERVPAKIYYSEGIQSKMSEGQRHVG